MVELGAAGRADFQTKFRGILSRFQRKTVSIFISRRFGGVHATGAVLVISRTTRDDCRAMSRPFWIGIAMIALAGTPNGMIRGASAQESQNQYPTPNPNPNRFSPRNLIPGGWRKTDDASARVQSAGQPQPAGPMHAAHPGHAAHHANQRNQANPGGGHFRVGSSEHRQSIIDAMPLERLTAEARTQILEIAEKPTLFRQLPDQSIACDQDMFLFLTRNPDVLVGLWELMGITQVETRRTGPYQMEAIDGAGTTCLVDLVYGDAQQHIFVVEGAYDGKMTPAPIRGKGVFVLRSDYGIDESGQTTVSGTLHCFVQLESLGLDLIARTFSPIIGRSADSNFEQTARFISQVSQSSAHNPSAMLDIAARLPQVEPPTRQAFGHTIMTVARRESESRLGIPTDRFGRHETEPAPDRLTRAIEEAARSSR